MGNGVIEPAEPFFQAGGPLDPAAPSYVRRPADDALREALKRNDYCLVFSPRQSGKSSLLARAIADLRRTGHGAVVLDCQGKPADVDPWFRFVVYQIARDLKIKTDAVDWWTSNERHPPMPRFAMFLQDVVLKERQGNVFVFLDEVDWILDFDYANEFFSTIRSFFGARAVEPEWKRLTFILSGVVDETRLIKSRSRTGFNVGRRIELEDFRVEHAKFFEPILGPGAERLVDRIFYWTAGQPLLVQQLATAAHTWPVDERTPERLDRQVEESFLTTDRDALLGRDLHFKWIQDYVLDRRYNVRAGLRLYARILKGWRVPENEDSLIQTRLKLAGLVRSYEGVLNSRNRIYERIFDGAWIQRHMPHSRRAYAIAGALVAASLVGAGVTGATIRDGDGASERRERIRLAIQTLAETSDEGEALRAHGVLQELDVSDATARLDDFWQRRGKSLLETAHRLRDDGETDQAALLAALAAVKMGAANGEISELLPQRLVRTLRGNSAPVDRAVFSPDGRFVVAAFEDGSLRQWQVESGGLVAEARPLVKDEEDAAATALPSVLRFRGDRLLVASNTAGANAAEQFFGAVRVAVLRVDARGMQLLGQVHEFDDGVESADLDPRGNRLLTAGSKARLWKLPEWQLLATNTADRYAGLTHAEFSAGGEYVVTASEAGGIQVWDRELRHTLFRTRVEGRASSATLSANSDRLAATAHGENSASRWLSGSVKVWQRTDSPQVAFERPWPWSSPEPNVEFAKFCQGKPDLFVVAWNRDSSNAGHLLHVGKGSTPYSWEGGLVLDANPDCTMGLVAYTSGVVRIWQLEPPRPSKQPDPAREWLEWQLRLGLTVNADFQVVPLGGKQPSPAVGAATGAG